MTDIIKKENKQPISFRLTPAILRQLDELSDKTGIPKAQLLENALIKTYGFTAFSFPTAADFGGTSAADAD